jgi:hypothetical protein
VLWLKTRYRGGYRYAGGAGGAAGHRSNGHLPSPTARNSERVQFLVLTCRYLPNPEGSQPSFDGMLGGPRKAEFGTKAGATFAGRDAFGGKFEANVDQQ